MRKTLTKLTKQELADVDDIRSIFLDTIHDDRSGIMSDLDILLKDGLAFGYENEGLDEEPESEKYFDHYFMTINEAYIISINFMQHVVDGDKIHHFDGLQYDLILEHTYDEDDPNDTFHCIENLDPNDRMIDWYESDDSNIAASDSNLGQLTYYDVQLSAQKWLKYVYINDVKCGLPSTEEWNMAHDDKVVKYLSYFTNLYRKIDNTCDIYPLFMPY